MRPKAHDQLYTISVEVSRDRIVWSAPAFDDWGLQRRIMSPHRIEDVADESLAYFLKYHYGSDPTRMPAYIRVRAWPGVLGSVVKTTPYVLELRTVVADGCRQCTALEQARRSQ